jgi:putative transposase
VYEIPAGYITYGNIPEMLKGFSYRLYPTEDQRVLMEKTFGCCRYVWNTLLEMMIEDRKNGIYYSHFDLCKKITEMKTCPDKVWLNEPNSQSFQVVAKNLSGAFTAMKSGKGFPRFKRKNLRESFGCPQHCTVDFENSTLCLPKIPGIKMEISRTFTGDIRTVTIKKSPSGKYLVSVLVDNHKSFPLKSGIDPTTAIGIDLGLKDFVVTSTGIRIPNCRYLRNSLDRLKVLQRRASRKVKGSNNRKKAYLKVARQHENVTNQRKDFLHKASTRIIRENQTISVESLAVKNMVKNHSLALSISDAGWAEFLRQLEYKARWNGRNFIKTGRFFPSSKTCSDCQEVLEDLPLEIRAWDCPNCHAHHDRDINAAKNIRVEGLKILTGEGISGEPVESGSMDLAKKQEKCKV